MGVGPVDLVKPYGEIGYRVRLLIVRLWVQVPLGLLLLLSIYNR